MADNEFSKAPYSMAMPKPNEPDKGPRWFEKHAPNIEQHEREQSLADAQDATGTPRTAEPTKIRTR